MPPQPLGTKSPDEILHWLRTNETPLDVVEVREGRAGVRFYYLRHQYVTETLNTICGFDWDFEVLREEMREDEVMVLGQLTVRIGERTIRKAQYGGAPVERYSSGDNQGKIISLGDAYKSAASDALKKAASLIGIGLDLSLPIQPKTMRHLHAAGTKVFKEHWDARRHRAVRILTGGRHRDKSKPADSSWQLLDVEARTLIAVIEGSLESELAQQAAALLKS